MRFVSIVIKKSSLLNIEMIFFLILSSTAPLLLLTVAKPLALYRSKFSFLNSDDNFHIRQIPIISHISVPSKLPIVTQMMDFHLFKPRFLLQEIAVSEFNSIPSEFNYINYFILIGHYGSSITNSSPEKIFQN